jgi:branched-chain amino acid aminotransferase
LSLDIQISQSNKSKIDKVDFSNFTFGSVFTDHMFECDYINGKWQNPKILPYQSISIEPSASVFHYGQAIFEGMKAYKDSNDELWLFRPKENFHRFNKSSVRLAIPEFPEELFFDALKKLLNLDKEWVKKDEGSALYVRPFVIGNEYAIQASPSKNYKFMIICAPATPYYKGKVKVIVADKYSRAASGGVGFAKAAGNYAGQFYPTNLAKERGFQQIIWTDSNQHKYLEEAGTMNVFFRIGEKLITAPTTDTILDGVTRKSIIQIAKDQGIDVEVRRITIDEIKEASRNSSLKEIFGTGTAAVVSEISEFEHRDELFILPEIEDSYAKKLKKCLVNIQTNKAEDPHNWKYKV